LAVITGASSGIGAEIAAVLARKGCDLRLVARRGDRLQALAADLAARFGAQSVVDVVDLTVPAAVDAWIADVRAAGRPVAWLVNNAGFGAHAATLEIPSARLREMLRLNVEALVVASREFGADMAARGGGRIVNVASTAAFQPVPWFGAYAATKAFVLSFTEALAIELRGRVTVTAVCPGQTRTEFVGSANMDGRFDRTPSMSAADVAELGIAAAEKGRIVCVTGFFNRFQTFLSRMLPHDFIRWSAAKLFRK
jgi:short-subunit dehydrogenase